MISILHTFGHKKVSQVLAMGFASNISFMTFSCPNFSGILSSIVREQFKMTSLLTSRSTNHGFHNARYYEGDPRCLHYYQDYLRTGYINFVDGTVCDAPLPTEACSITDGIYEDYC